ncbi:extended synaptotagmin-1-like isoform X3 [Octopus vulgaris]|uniref:Extended synaptotagmin-1-like isoform X3 n=1 Tax=Octopus vulgaris TaxID=6645 RepID=A0AA36B051_OCTVU|nr:extended synaptotagmin-1-like isoform X3 [Octopus vulgaris]
MCPLKFKEKNKISPEEQLQTQRLNRDMGYFYLFVASIVAIAWLLGAFGFSFIWTLGLIGILFSIWKTKLFNLIRKISSLEQLAVHRKRALRQNETAEWLNFLFNRWWVFSSTSIQDLVKRRLDDRMMNIKPAFLKQLELLTFSLGINTPTVRHIRVFEYAEGVPRGSKTLAWLDITKPPPGLENKSSFKVVVEVDVDMISEDFRMIFKVGLGARNIGFNVAIEELTIRGTLQINLDMSMDTPFPHFSKATVYFTETPDVWFNISVMGGLQVMEMPLLKTWIHTHVKEGITKALVDPAKLDVSLASVGPVQYQRSMVKRQCAQGVLTIHIKGYPKPNIDNGLDDVVYTVLRLSDHKRQCPEVYDSQNWEDLCSFLVSDLATDKLHLKYKCKRLLTSVTLEEHEILLSQYPFQIKGEVDTILENKDGSKLYLSLQYTPLAPIKLESSIKDEQVIKDVAGVLYVHIHGATNLLAADKNGTSDPYCVVFSERRRIVTTPYVPRSLNPRWETYSEFFVKDFTKTKLSFYVFDWDGRNIIDDDFLGCAFLDVHQKENFCIRKALSLGNDRPSSGFVADKSLGYVIVSVIFRPVPSVAKSENYQPFQTNFSQKLYVEDKVSPQSMAENKNSRQSLAFIEKYLEGKTFVDFKIIQAKNLESKDRNGFSDPFCEVMLGKKKLFKTSVKKKTLFPIWNESATLELPDDNNTTIELVLSDKDLIYDDFLGNLTLTVSKMKEMSLNGHPEWFPLTKCKSGSLQLQCTVTSKDTLENGKAENVSSEELNHDVSKSKTTKSPTQSSLQEESSYGRSSSDTHIASPGSSRINSIGPACYPPEDGSSLDGSILSADKYYSVSGTVVQGRHLMLLEGDVYCKVRLQTNHLSNARTKLRSSGRILGRSTTVKAQLEPQFNLNFEVDRGAGVSAEALLVFDMKKATKEHLASKAFTIRELLGENESGTVRKWLTLNNNIELEVELVHGKPDSNHQKKPGIFRNFSFRKDKQH